MDLWSILGVLGLIVGVIGGLLGWRWWTMRDYLIYSHQYEKFATWEEKKAQEPNNESKCTVCGVPTPKGHYLCKQHWNQQKK